MSVKPIKPGDTEIPPTGILLDEAISFINDSIVTKDWHDNFADPKEIIENYFAIILPLHKFNNILLDNVVLKFKEFGWDCLHQSCYDARGPHHCFYVHKKHFTETPTRPPQQEKRK